MENRSARLVKHQENHMRSKKIFYPPKVPPLNLVFALLLFTLSQPAYPQESDATVVVYRLYHDFGWEALFASLDDAKKALGLTLLMQPKEILEKYFDNKLALLISKEASCVKKNIGKLCKLEFNPMFASQDASASELSIKLSNPKNVDVQFLYPANHERIKISYDMTKTSKGWKIADIKYANSNASLKELLSK